MQMQKNFEKQTFAKGLGSMLNVDIRRMFTQPLIYIMVGVAFLIPVLVLVMTSTMAEDPSADTFASVWQAIGSVSGSSAGMSLTGMCNINLVYFLAAVFVCIFVADDFRSGYVKNLFAVRPRKSDYVISKTAVAFIGGTIMLIMFFVGALFGGAFAGLPFSMEGFNAGNLVASLIAKIFLMAAFAAIYVLMGVIAKQRLWLSVLLSLGVGMFLFNIIPMVSPLDANVLHVLLCLVGGCMFGAGLGAVSDIVLKKTNLV